MEKKFLSMMTRKGREKMAEAVVNGEKVIFSHMAVGDGNGNTPRPDDEQESLVNELFRTSLNSFKVVDNENNVIAAEMIIPPEVGGFTIREAALFDEDGNCLAAASTPETYKPQLSEGSGRFTILRMWIAVSSTENVELIVEPGMVLATIEDIIRVENAVKDYTDEQIGEHEKSRNHPDATLKEKGFTRLSNAIDSDDQNKAATPAAIKAAIASAIRSAWELENPVGTVRFYAQNVNPNEIYPWSRWDYTGENKSIRVGKSDGSNIGATGGSDSVTLQQANLPAVQIDVSGKTSEQPEQTLTTKPAGRHKHGGVPSRDNPWEIGGDISQRFNPANLGDTDEATDHEHDIDIPPHHHDVTGKTANLGEGKSFSVVEAHTLLMCWSRVA